MRWIARGVLVLGLVVEAFGGTTSTSTTSSTVTTTTLVGCDTAATFDAVQCLIDAYETALANAGELGRTRKNLEGALSKLQRQVNEAADASGSGDARGAKNKLKKAGRTLTSLAHRLKSLSGRNNIPDTVREALLDDATELASRVKALRGSL